MGGPPLQRWGDTNGLPIRVPTAKAMGHPTPQLMADGALARRRPRLPQTVQRGSAFQPISLRRVRGAHSVKSRSHAGRRTAPTAC